MGKETDENNNNDELCEDTRSRLTNEKRLKSESCYQNFSERIMFRGQWNNTFSRFSYLSAPSI